MSKEQLEEIQERALVDKVYYKYLDGRKGHWGKIYTLNEEDYKYLIKQAERVQELERELTYYKMATESYEEMESQNKRYREVLNRIRITTKEETTHRWVHRALEGEE